jgi:endonuclease/exonuclease/phosphatase family metal-dependent hydrolase
MACHVRLIVSCLSYVSSVFTVYGNMRHSLLLLLFLLPAIYACTNPEYVTNIMKQPGTGTTCVKQGTNSESAAACTNIRVMTFNIRWQGYDENGKLIDSGFAHRKPLVLDVLTKFGADIIGLQEASIEQRSALAPGLPGFGMFPLSVEAGDECILYRLDRFELRESGHEALRRVPEQAGTNIGVRDFVWVHLEDRISGKRFYVLNLHADHRSSERGRELDGVRIGEWISNRKFADPVILTGDFNGNPDQPRYLYLTGQRAYADEDGKTVPMPVPMLDTFREAHPHAIYSGTINAGFKGVKNRKQIDFIFVPHGSTVIGSDIIYYHVDDSYPSDHFPLLSEFEFE